LAAVAERLADGAPLDATPAAEAERTAARLAHVLGEAEAGLEQRVRARAQYAREAAEKAQEHENDAQAELKPRVKDQWVAERRQATLLDAAVERANAERDERIRERYDLARQRAAEAQHAYQALADALN